MAVSVGLTGASLRRARRPRLIADSRTTQALTCDMTSSVIMSSRPLNPKVRTDGRIPVSSSGRPVVPSSGRQVVKLSGRQVIASPGRHAVGSSVRRSVGASGRHTVRASRCRASRLPGHQVARLFGRQVIRSVGRKGSRSIGRSGGRKVGRVGGQQRASRRALVPAHNLNDLRRTGYRLQACTASFWMKSDRIYFTSRDRRRL